MKEYTDDDLINEVKRRFEEKSKIHHDMINMTRKIEVLNDALRHAESSKSNFLSNIRNQINNPLTVVMGMANHLSKGALDQESTVLAAEAIYRETCDLDFQLKNIFTAAEIEAGESSLSTSRINIVALISGMVDSFRRKAAEKQLQLIFHVEKRGTEEDIWFTTDPGKLSCILSNLLANAIEFTEKEKRIWITAKKEAACLALIIEDEGPGVPDKDRKRIFDRFVQLDTGLTRKHKGHGLGLSIVKALAEMLDGKVVLSPAECGGSIFTLSMQEMIDGGMPGEIDAKSNAFISDEAQKY